MYLDLIDFQEVSKTLIFNALINARFCGVIYVRVMNNLNVPEYYWDKQSIFKEDKTMRNLEQALSEVENGLGTEETNTSNAFDIIVKNGQTSQKTTLYVTPANTLKQVFEATARDLGFNINKTNNIYVNEKTSQSATDSAVTLKEFQVNENTVISIEQDGKVAAE